MPEAKKVETPTAEVPKAAEPKPAATPAAKPVTKLIPDPRITSPIASPEKSAEAIDNPASTDVVNDTVTILRIKYGMRRLTETEKSTMLKLLSDLENTYRKAQG